MLTVFRFTLEYKGLPYTTVWLDLPDIAPTLQELNIAPTGKWQDGSPMYTLPAIVDPSTGAALADSAAIARYLDTAYPDTPRAFPAGTDTLIAAFQAAFESALSPHAFYIGLPAMYRRVHDVSKARFKAARESVVGGRMEDWNPPGTPKAAQNWAALEAGFGKVAAWMDAGGEGRPFVMGDVPCYADFIVGARLSWLKKALGDESEEWLRVEQWHGGRWARLLERMDTLGRRV